MRRCWASSGVRWRPTKARKAGSRCTGRSACRSMPYPSTPAAVKPATRDDRQEPAARSSRPAARCADARRARGPPARLRFRGVAPVARTGARRRRTVHRAARLGRPGGWHELALRRGARCADGRGDPYFARVLGLYWVHAPTTPPERFDYMVEATWPIDGEKRRFCFIVFDRGPEAQPGLTAPAGTVATAIRDRPRHAGRRAQPVRDGRGRQLAAAVGV